MGEIDFDTAVTITIGGLFATIVFAILRFYWLRFVIARRIDAYRFPEHLARRVGKQYPHLDRAQIAQVIDGLREYFHLTNLGAGRMIAMPSQAVDVAWHELILSTRQYDRFCRDVLGRFLHHTPAEAMRGPTDAQDGIKRAWRLSCKREGIDPVQPAALPLLFALDARLGIGDGFHYDLDCQRDASGGYCASHIGCGGGCGGSSGDPSGDGDGGCGGGCGGD